MICGLDPLIALYSSIDKQVHSQQGNYSIIQSEEEYICKLHIVGNNVKTQGKVDNVNDKTFN